MNENIFQIARQQVDLVKSVLGKRFTFEDNSTNEAQSGYTTYGTLETPTALIVVRLSNHICSMNNWTTRYKPKLIANNKLARRMGNNLQLPYKERCFFSVVFKAFDYTPNDVGNWKAICREYVFNPLEIEKSGTIGNISQDCLKLNSNEIISINGQNPIDRIAKKANSTENNQEIKENRNMNKKQTIKINEAQLKQIVAEYVKRVLKEVKLTGKSGKTYSLHGNDPESWLTMNNIRHNRRNGDYTNIYKQQKDWDNFIETDDASHPNPKSRNNANRISAMSRRAKNAADDLSESNLQKIVTESVKRVLKEWEEPDYAANGKYYVAADSNSDYFDDYNEAYNYALKLANNERKMSPDDWEEIHLMDNEEWQSIVIFNETGIHDLENGTFIPWRD